LWMQFAKRSNTRLLRAEPTLLNFFVGCRPWIAEILQRFFAGGQALQAAQQWQPMTSRKSDCRMQGYNGIRRYIECACTILFHHAKHSLRQIRNAEQLHDWIVSRQG